MHELERKYQSAMKVKLRTASVTPTLLLVLVASPATADGLGGLSRGRSVGSWILGLIATGCSAFCTVGTKRRRRVVSGSGKRRRADAVRYVKEKGPDPEYAMRPGQWE